LFVSNLPQDDYSFKTTTDISPEISSKIISRLRGNLVHSVAFQNGRSIDLPLVQQDVCKCVICTYRTLNFADSLKMLPEIQEEDEPTLKIAYAFFLHGQMIPAVDTLKAVAARADLNKEWLTLYIATYNLVLIGRLMRYHLVTDPSQKALYKELSDLSLNDTYIKCQSSSINDILDHLRESRFMNDAIEKAKDLVAKIKDNLSDQHGGWNDHTRLLLDLFFETVGVMEHNYIMLEEFSEIGTLTSYFIDGLFASYASRKDLGGKLLYFTGPIVEKIIAYGKYDDIIKYRRRYNIKIADYQAEIEHRDFVDQLIGQLDSYPDAMSYYESSDNESQQFFWPKYRRMFHNAVTMASMLKITKDDVNRICEKLFPFLMAEKHFHDFEVSRTLSYFIWNNVQFIELKHLEAFILFAYTSDSTHCEELINTLSDVARNKPFYLTLNDQEWQLLATNYLVNNELKKDISTINEICCLYGFLTDKAYKEEIAKFLLYYLKNEFDPHIYYWAVMHNLLKPTKLMTRKFEVSVITLAEEGRRARPFEAGFYHDHRLDEFINFSFRFNRPLPPVLVEALIKLDDYYCWLTNPETFDYSLFETEWLFNHYTMYFKKKYKESQALQRCLRQLALNASDHRLGQLYIDVYTQ
jgi:hypothetical protein